MDHGCTTTQPWIHMVRHFDSYGRWSYRELPASYRRTQFSRPSYSKFLGVKLAYWIGVIGAQVELQRHNLLSVIRHGPSACLAVRYTNPDCRDLISTATPTPSILKELAPYTQNIFSPYLPELTSLLLNTLEYSCKISVRGIDVYDLQ
jgi:hypothetical protein